MLKIMSGPTFDIDTDNQCFTPLTCATSSGHLVVWGTESDSNDDQLCVREYRCNQPAGEKKILTTIENEDRLAFLEAYSNDQYALCIDCEQKYIVYILNANGNIIDTQTVETADILIKCYKTASNDTVLFVYNSDCDQLTIKIVRGEESWQQATVIKKYSNVWVDPKVFVYDSDNYIAAWVDYSDQLQIVAGNIYDTNVVNTVLSDYQIDYLMGAKINAEWCILGGYFTATNTLRIDYCRLVEGRIEVITRFWKTSDYNGLSFTMEPLCNGFMLLADRDQKVCGQRFTHLGSWLYPLMKLENSSQATFSGTLSQGSDSTLLVYLKDGPEQTQLSGKWLFISEIPELMHLSLSEV